MTNHGIDAALIRVALRADRLIDEARGRDPATMTVGIDADDHALLLSHRTRARRAGFQFRAVGIFRYDVLIRAR